MKKDEKRKHRRIDSLNLSYVCLDENDRIVKQGMGRTLNVSEAGILLETHFEISPAHRVILSIGFEDDLVDVQGRVAHTHTKADNLYEVGIEFVDPDEMSLATIREFMRAATNFS
jgi:hypothetical protein